MTGQVGITPAVRCEGELVRVLNNRPTSDVQVKVGGSGGVNPQLLTGKEKYTVFTVLKEYRARHWTT